MKRMFQFLLVLVFQISFLLPQSCLSQIVDAKGKILPEVILIFRHYKPLIEKNWSEIAEKRGLSLCQMEKVLDSQTPLADISLSDLNDIAQTVFLRPVSLERKDTAHLKNKFLPYTSEEVFDLFRSIGDVDDVDPKENHYRYILLNGSTVQSMRHRIKALIHFVESKKLLITPETEIIFLTGERDLFKEENEKQLMVSKPLKLNPQWEKPSKLPLTEDQAAEWIWNQADLPQSLRKCKITFVRAKKKEVVDPNTNKTVTKRPTTYDTIQTWVVTYSPEPGNCLSVSDQPYVYYQQATIYGFLRKMGLIEKGFSVDGAGTRKDSSSTYYKSFRDNIQIILDNFARTIYTEVR